MWNIDGTPTPTAGTAGTEPAPTEPTEPTADPRPPATEAPAGTITAALRKEGRMGMFLKVVAAAGKEQQLASATLTLLVPHESAFQRKWKTTKEFNVLLADKARCLAIYNDHVAKGVITKDLVRSSKDVVVTTLSGKTHHLTFDTGYALDGEVVEDKVLEADHSVAYIIQALNE